MTKSITIQISVLNINEDLSTMGRYYGVRKGYEFIYEAEISNLTEFISLVYSLHKYVKYKKPTDKVWYSARTMAKRLFKNEGINDRPIMKIIKVHSWDEKYEQEEARKKRPDSRRKTPKEIDQIELFGEPEYDIKDFEESLEVVRGF